MFCAGPNRPSNRGWLNKTRGSIWFVLGLQNRPEWVSCRPINKSLSLPITSLWEATSVSRNCAIAD